MKRSWWMGLLVGTVFGAVAFTTMASLHAASGGSASGARVVCVDIDAIFGEYERVKDLTEQMRVAEQDIKNEADRRRTQIDGLQATIDAMSLSDPALVKRQRELLQMQFEFKNWSDLMQADMAREVGLWTRKNYEEILTVVQGIAQREQYDLVLYREAPGIQGFDPVAVKEQIRARKLVYASPTADVTQAVVDRLNADYRSRPKTQMLQLSPLTP